MNTKIGLFIHFMLGYVKQKKETKRDSKCLFSHKIQKKQERERLRFYFLVGAHTIINNDEFKAEVEKHLIEMCCGVSASSQ